MVAGGSRSTDEITGTVDEPASDELDEETDLDDLEADGLELDVDDLEPFDDDGEDDADDIPVAAAPAVDDEDEDDVADLLVEDLEDDDEGLREGEFICASCHLVKGPTQLANARRRLCVDCV